MKTGLGWNSWRPLLLTVGDQAIFLLSLAAALAIRQAGQVEQSFLLQHLFAFLPLFVLWQLTLYAFDLYDFKILREMVQLINMIWIGGTINLVLGMAYFYLLQPYLGLTPKTHLLLAAVLAHIGIMAWRRVWVGWMQSEGLRQRVVLLAYDRAGMDLRKEIEAKPELGYQPVEWISPEVDLVVAENSWVQAHWDRAQGIIAETLRRGVPFIPLDTFRESLFGKVSIERASDPGWVLEFALPRSTGIYAAIKRPVEGATALLLLLLLAPALAAISVVLWCFEGRPLYYSQRRLGLLGSEFTLWKFRTMIEQADSEGPFSSARAADPRITRFGAWLRRFRLDELPQLWNVGGGDRAWVGRGRNGCARSRYSSRSCPSTT